MPFASPSSTRILACLGVFQRVANRFLRNSIDLALHNRFEALISVLLEIDLGGMHAPQHVHMLS